MNQQIDSSDSQSRPSPVLSAMKGVNVAAGDALAAVQCELNRGPRDPLQLAIALARGRLAFLQSLAHQVQSVDKR